MKAKTIGQLRCTHAEALEKAVKGDLDLEEGKELVAKAQAINEALASKIKRDIY